MADDTTQQTTDTASSNTDTQQAQNAGTTTGTQATTTTDTPIMTTAQLDERLERARKSLLKSLGYDDEKAAKTALEEAKKLKESQLSDAEKATKALTDAQKERDDAKAEIEALKTERKLSRFEGAIRKVAGDLKAKYPDDVFLKASGEAEFKKWFESDEPDEKAIKAWVEKLKTARPEWFTNGNGTPGSPSNRGAVGNVQPVDKLGADKLFKF